MTETLDPLPSPVEDAQFLLQELACVSGAVSEIMTMWRRARPFRPELEFGRLTRLQDAARRLGAEIRAAAGPPGRSSARRPRPACNPTPAAPSSPACRDQPPGAAVRPGSWRHRRWCSR